MANIKKETLLTQECVKELFDYKDGFLYRKTLHPKSLNGKSKIGEAAGYISKTHSGERRIIRISKYSYYSSRLIFFFHYNWWPDMVDHKDRNTLNDNIENLRAADNSDNAKNVSKQLGKTSKYLGVNLKIEKTTRALKTTGELKTWTRESWCAQGSLNKKKVFIVRYATEKEAALAYNEFAMKNYGEFANINILD